MSQAMVFSTVSGGDHDWQWRCCQADMNYRLVFEKVKYVVKNTVHNSGNGKLSLMIQLAELSSLAASLEQYLCFSIDTGPNDEKGYSEIMISKTVCPI